MNRAANSAEWAALYRRFAETIRDPDVRAGFELEARWAEARAAWHAKPWNRWIVWPFRCFYWRLRALDRRR